ncbi:hypothetical protein SUDANB37_01510 [Streptomyces sp. enrichment culture]
MRRPDHRAWGGPAAGRGAAGRAESVRRRGRGEDRAAGAHVPGSSSLPYQTSMYGPSQYAGMSR